MIGRSESNLTTPHPICIPVYVAPAATLLPTSEAESILPMFVGGLLRAPRWPCHVLVVPALMRQVSINGATSISAPGFGSHQNPISSSRPGAGAGNSGV